MCPNLQLTSEWSGLAQHHAIEATDCCAAILGQSDVLAAGNAGAEVALPQVLTESISPRIYPIEYASAAVLPPAIAGR